MTDHGPQHATHELIASLQEQRREAAHELANLRAENARLRAALHQFACDDNWVHFTNDEYTWDIDGDPRKLAADALRGDKSDE